MEATTGSPEISESHIARREKSSCRRHSTKPIVQCRGELDGKQRPKGPDLSSGHIPSVRRENGGLFGCDLKSSVCTQCVTAQQAAGTQHGSKVLSQSKQA